MTKIIIATHERLADGLKHTLDYIAPNTIDVIAISAYLDNEPIQTVLENTIHSIDTNEQIIILTDLVGGSVNQECAKLLTSQHIMLISGVNFPLLLSLALSASQQQLTHDDIRQQIVDAKSQIIFVNDMLKQSTSDLDDE